MAGLLDGDALADGRAGAGPVVLPTELDGHQQRSRFRGEDDRVFAHPLLGVPLDRSRPRKRCKLAVAVAVAVAGARLRDVRFHDLRHTFGTRMAAADVPMRTLQEWLGHRSTSLDEPVSGV